MSKTIQIPKRGKGKLSRDNAEIFKSAQDSFYRDLLEINNGLPFKVSARGWCYILEEHGLTKGDFKTAQDLINEGRKNGALPLDFTASDSTRAYSCIEYVSRNSQIEESKAIIERAKQAHESYSPLSTWDYQKYYIEIMVEKIDLKSMFSDQCYKFNIPIANAKGWSDINMRADSIMRFKKAESKGLIPVLLYCGDFDPAGLNISDTIRKNLNDLERATGWNADDLIIDRFGLNYDFIVTHNLSWVNNLETGSGLDLSNPKHPNHNEAWVKNYIEQYGAKKCEANALITRIDAGRALLDDTLKKYIDYSGFDQWQIDTKTEQLAVAELVNNLIVAP